MQLPPIKKEMAASLSQERQLKEASFRTRASLRRLRAIQLSGMRMLGRDKNGASVETLSPDAMRIKEDKWFVRLVFGKDDKAEMAGSKLEEAEAKIRQGGISRKEVRVITHIIRAVRLLDHIEEGYGKEIAETERIIRELDGLNVSLAGKAPHTNEEIDKAISFLENFGKSTLAKKHTAIKRIIAKERLEQTVEMLKLALTLSPGEGRGMQLGAACAKFTSLRNRLALWRSADIAWRMEYNGMKACSLRIYRDIWLLSRLVAFADNPAKIGEYIEKDRQKLRVLGSIRAMLQSNIRKEAILKIIEDNHSLFRIVERERIGAEDAIKAAEEKGELPEGEKKYDYQTGHLGWLYRHVKSGERKKALEKLSDLELFVNANKPRFILDELEKGHEPYLKGTVAAFRAAVLAFEANDYKAAQDGFIRSAELLAGTF